MRGTVTESHLRFVWRGWHLAHKSPKSSNALRNVGTGTGIVRFPARAPHRCRPSLQGVAPASPAPPLETRSSTRLPFGRYEFYEISGPVAELNAASNNDRVKKACYRLTVTTAIVLITTCFQGLQIAISVNLGDYYGGNDPLPSHNFQSEP